MMQRRICLRNAFFACRRHGIYIPKIKWRYKPTMYLAFATTPKQTNGNLMKVLEKSMLHHKFSSAATLVRLFPTRLP